MMLFPFEEAERLVEPFDFDYLDPTFLISFSLKVLLRVLSLMKAV